MASIKDTSLGVMGLEDSEKIWEMEKEWNNLLTKIPNSHPFMTPYWIGVTFDLYGVIHDGKIYALEVDRELAGIALLDVDMENKRGKILSPHYPYYFNEFIAYHEIREEFVEEILSALDVFIITQIPESSPYYWIMKKLAENKKYSINITAQRNLKSLIIPENVEKWLYKIKGKASRIITSTLKRAKRFEEIETKRIEDVSELVDRLVFLFNNSSHSKSSILEFKTFVENLAYLMVPRGILKLIELVVEGWTLASILVLEYRDRAYLLELSSITHIKDFDASIYLLFKYIEYLSNMGFKELFFFPTTSTMDFINFKNIKLLDITITTG